MDLEVRNISKAFGAEQVLSDISFRLESGSTIAVLGPSGCGKTTLLRIVAGFEHPDGGDVLLSGRSVTATPVERRGIVYLSQHALLFPHLSVRENIAFGLKLKDGTAKEIDTRVDRMLEALELSKHANKGAHQLSGGQKQRVAFGRAVVIDPAVVLLDEPFGSLDSETRRTMQNLFVSLSKQMGITAVFVTHDLKEAVLMGSSLATLRRGRLHVYASKEAFINDETTGVKDEIDFWKNLNIGSEC